MEEKEKKQMKIQPKRNGMQNVSDYQVLQVREAYHGECSRNVSTQENNKDTKKTTSEIFNKIDLKTLHFFS